MADPIQVVCVHCDAVNRLPPGRDARAGKCGRCGQALFDGRPAALTTARFRQHVARSGIPVIADFWAGWCGPCRTMAPIFERAAAELEPGARFVKIDVDAEPQLSADYGVRGIPALFLFRDGKVAAHHSGVADPSLLRQWAGGSGA
ncbi:thioredoxin TrxC [Phenylobacterium sp.]|uniref:thioredoxin TrxC n=1 Tax=Phenylobacterium sp. TaxID=1871053 RepID=UPI002F3EE74C